jgi:predicted dehydrogenase
MGEEEVTVAVVGAGAWGMNHVRAFSRLGHLQLAHVAVWVERVAAASFAPEALPGWLRGC